MGPQLRIVCFYTEVRRGFGKALEASGKYININIYIYIYILLKNTNYIIYLTSC